MSFSKFSSNSSNSLSVVIGKGGKICKTLDGGFGEDLFEVGGDDLEGEALLLMG